jgi:hypothetical protein
VQRPTGQRANAGPDCRPNARNNRPYDAADNRESPCHEIPNIAQEVFDSTRLKPLTSHDALDRTVRQTAVRSRQGFP